jgi:hypothetical protein
MYELELECTNTTHTDTAHRTYININIENNTSNVCKPGKRGVMLGKGEVIVSKSEYSTLQSGFVLDLVWIFKIYKRTHSQVMVLVCILIALVYLISCAISTFNKNHLLIKINPLFNTIIT